MPNPLVGQSLRWMRPPCRCMICTTSCVRVCVQKRKRDECVLHPSADFGSLMQAMKRFVDTLALTDPEAYASKGGTQKVKNHRHTCVYACGCTQIECASLQCVCVCVCVCVGRGGARAVSPKIRRVRTHVCISL